MERSRIPETPFDKGKRLLHGVGEVDEESHGSTMALTSCSTGDFFLTSRFGKG
jgi:hypothetical protein